MYICATSEFSTWASGFSGCDGGNLAGKLWVCGIEYGANEDPDRFAFGDVSKPSCVQREEHARALQDQYNVKVAKLYAALIGQAVSTYYQTAIEKQLFGSSSDLFKMNLYPIAFHDESDKRWKKWIYDRTGLPTKSLYRAWCQLNRFPRFREWMHQSTPRLVIGTGASYRDDFIMAFSGVEELFAEMPKETIQDRRLLWKPVNDGQTVLAITPFLGRRYGLNSDALLDAFGRRLRAICAEKFGRDWITAT
jgi:hypothetical protein